DRRPPARDEASDDDQVAASLLEQPVEPVELLASLAREQLLRDPLAERATEPVRDVVAADRADRGRRDDQLEPQAPALRGQHRGGDHDGLARHDRKKASRAATPNTIPYVHAEPETASTKDSNIVPFWQRRAMSPERGIDAGGAKFVEPMTALLALSAAIEAHDPYTRGHSERVARMACKVGLQLRCDDVQLSLLRLGGTLHDVGKLVVRDAILSKPGPLTVDEIAEVQLHPEAGARLVALDRTLRPVLPAVLYHHERWDGAGYP